MVNVNWLILNQDQGFHNTAPSVNNSVVLPFDKTVWHCRLTSLYAGAPRCFFKYQEYQNTNLLDRVDFK